MILTLLSSKGGGSGFGRSGIRDEQGVRATVLYITGWIPKSFVRNGGLLLYEDEHSRQDLEKLMKTYLPSILLLFL